MFHVGEYLPNYFEVLAAISTEKPIKGYKANSYVVFDYVGPDDFKFAGINISTDKLELGHRDADGWHVDVQTPAKLRPEREYDVLVALNGVTATLVVGSDVLSHAFDPRTDPDGFTYGLNFGMVGLGAQNAFASIDNVSVQILKPEVTFEQAVDFGDGSTGLFGTPIIGDWEVAEGAYSATEAEALSGFELEISPNAALELAGDFTAGVLGGFFFDYYGADDYKFAGIDAVTDEVVIGHVGRAGSPVVDAVAGLGFTDGPDYDLRVTLKGTTASVAVGAESSSGDLVYHEVLGHAFNAVTVDGAFGLLGLDGGISFDSAAVATDDTAYLADDEALEAAAIGSGAAAIDAEALVPIVAEAERRLLAARPGNTSLRPALDGVDFELGELDGADLARANGNTIVIDADAAGHGWFVDPTPGDDAEFPRRDGDGRAAVPASPAAGRMDLLTAVTHELGHVIGLDHGDAAAFMDDTLEAGLRLVPPPTGDAKARQEAPTRLFDEALGTFLRGDWARWLDSLDVGSGAVYAPFEADYGLDGDEEEEDSLEPAVLVSGDEGAEEQGTREGAGPTTDRGELRSGVDTGLSSLLVDWNARFEDFRA